jgi:hypothetical protein
MIIPDEVKRLARAGKDKKLQAIWALRRATGVGLALAKEIVETLAAGGEVQLATPAPASSSEDIRKQHFQQQLDAVDRARRAGVLNNEQIGKLLETLHGDEDVLDLAEGTYDNCIGVLVATQNRLLFLSEEMVDGLNVEEFLLDSIYLVHFKAGLHGPTIKIFMSGYNRAEFTSMKRDIAKSFAECLKARVMFRADELGQLGPLDHLEQIEAMYENGIISTEELVDHRQRILDEIQLQSGQQARGKRRPS